MNALEEGLKWLKNATPEDIEKLKEELKEYTKYGPRLLTEEEHKEMEDTRPEKSELVFHVGKKPTYKVGGIIDYYDEDGVYREVGPITHIEFIDDDWVYFFINKKTREENCLSDYQILTM